MTIVGIALLLMGYWLIDAIVRHERGLGRLPRGRGPTSWTRFLVLVAAAALASIRIDWNSVPEQGAIRILVTTLTVVLTWKHATQDIDVATAHPLTLQRGLLVALAAAAIVWPALLLPWLYLVLRPFAGWTHHGMLPIRLLTVFLALLLVVLALTTVSPAWAAPDARGIGRAFFLVAIACQISHYFVPGLGKLRLGRRWWSWVTDNQLHLIVASAYSWGWLRFLHPETMARLIRAVRPFDRAFQATTLSIEVGSILVLLHPALFQGWTVAVCVMHATIFAWTGIFFWEWMATNVAMAVAMVALEPAVAASLFGPTEVLVVGTLILAARRARGRLWSPLSLAWWDTAFTARVHWELVGESSRRYGLYNDFMCPHEGLFGRAHGHFMLDDRIVTYHLGEVFAQAVSPHHGVSRATFEPFVAHELRDSIIASAGDPAALAELKARHGAVLRDAARERHHVQYMIRFCRALNAGVRKSVLPRGLRWLKAPGGQFYYWGDLEPYRRQEKVTKLIVRYEERFFDGARFIGLEDRVVREIVVDGPPDAAPGADDPSSRRMMSSGG
jgi:hypothetical protein